MKDIIKFIRQNEFETLKDIITYKIKQYTATVKDSVNTEMDFYEEGGLKYIKLSTNNNSIIFKTRAEYDSFLFEYEVFSSKGESLLASYIIQHSIINIQNFIETYSRSTKVIKYLKQKLELNLVLHFEKDFIVKDVMFLDKEGRLYCKLDPSKFYVIINKLGINK